MKENMVGSREHPELVYSTNHKQLPTADIASTDDSGLGREAREELRDTIKSMHKSKKRRESMTAGVRVGAGGNGEKIKRFEKVFNLLLSGKKTHKQIAELFPDLDKKKVDNMMQDIRYASDHIIYSKGGFWQIHPGFEGDNQGLLKKIIDNRGARWRKLSSSRATEKKRQQAAAAKGVAERIQVPSISKLVLESKDMIITIDGGNISIVSSKLKLNLTV